MEYDANKFLAEAKFPFWQQCSRYLLLLSDKLGNIIKIWEEGRYIHHMDILQPVKREKNLFACFDFKGIKDFSELPGNIEAYPGRLEHFRLSDIEGITTRMPICWIKVNPVDENTYLCALFVPEFIPNIYYQDAGALIYTDSRDNLLGFNNSFYRYFKQTFSLPHDLLGLPCSTFFAPAPNQIQSSYFTAAQAVPAETYLEVFSLEAGSLEKGLVGIRFQGQFQTAEKGWLWENRQDSHDYLSIDQDINTLKTDFILDIQFTLLEGYLPLIIVGDRYEGNWVLDAYGYTLGPDPENNKMFLKKYGFYIAESDQACAPQSGTHHFRLIKQKQAFILYLDDREVLKYYDFEIIENERACVSLSLRPGSRGVVHEVSLKTKKMETPLKREDVLVRLTAQDEFYFAINRFYNRVLSISFKDIRGYVLRNVTALKKDISRFQNLYQDEKRQGERLQSLLTSMEESDALFLGSSAPIQAIREKADIIANSNATILVQGETGTGKEVLAKYIHSRSPYSKGPFIKVDCSTLAPTLIESELFGHEKGAFTGAFEGKKGKIEQANTGTLFLDEVNNLGLDVQAKILGFLQDFTITRVGGQKPVSLNLRIIIASNIRLEDMVRRGMFREDLFFRINIVSVELPRLSERLDDIPQLCEYFIGIFANQHGKRIMGLTSAAYQKLYRYAWPGNVRELKNVLQRAVIFCEAERIDERLIQFPNQRTAELPAPGRPMNRDASRESDHHPVRPLSNVSKNQFIEIIRRHNGNVKRIAATLGISRQSMYYNLRRFKIDISEYRKRRRR